VQDHGFDKADAYQLVSQVAVVRVANVVDPNYTVVAKFPKRFLPDRVAPATRAGLRLSELSWTEAEKVLTPERIVVLPLGAASKEHGPHLTLGNDQILADYYASRVLVARDVAMLPTLTYGFYPAFLDFPGSTSVSFETQRDAIAQIVRGVARHGPRRFYVLNTGVSTARPLKATAELLAREGIVLQFSDVLQIGKAAEDAVREQKFGTHADEIETSMMLYMRPAAVRMDKAVKDGGEPAAGPLTRDRAKGGHYAPSGVFGDATLASWQKGQRVVEQAVMDLLAGIDALASAPIPAGEPGSPLEPAVREASPRTP
jgi:creatinine amidohydrolase